MTLATLDETLTVEADAPALAGPYVYSRLRDSSGGGLAYWSINREARSWEELRDATEVYLYHRDDVGQELPDRLPDGAERIRLEFPESAQVLTWTLRGYDGPDRLDDWAGQPTRNYAVITVAPPAETVGGENLPGMDAEARVTALDSTEATTSTLWCARMDFTLGDMLDTDAAGLVEVQHDSRFQVRWADTWAVGDRFTYRGDSWQVRALSEIGRRRGLELLARRMD